MGSIRERVGNFRVGMGDGVGVVIRCEDGAWRCMDKNSPILCDTRSSDLPGRVGTASGSCESRVARSLVSRSRGLTAPIFWADSNSTRAADAKLEADGRLGGGMSALYR